MAVVVPSKKAIVKQMLLSDIQTGKYTAGQKLAGEGQLAKQFGVSPSTVHNVLGELAREGLVERIFGSGTYIRGDSRPSIAVHVPMSPSDEKKPLFKLFWGKTVECASRWSPKVTLKKSHHVENTNKWDTKSMVVRLFSGPEPVGMFDQATANELPWLVKLGLCEDMTTRFHGWSQVNNVYPIAMKSVTCDGKIYALPFTSTLTGLTYRREFFEQIDMAPEEAVGSVDGFVRAAEQFAAMDEMKHSLWSSPVRSLAMYLLHAFYDTLETRFSLQSFNPIDRAVGVEVLRIIQHLHWKCRALILDGHPFSGNLSNLGRGMIPMAMLPLLPSAAFCVDGMPATSPMEFLPLSWSPRKQPFALYNACIFFINPNADAAVRDFWWTVLEHYIHPQSVSELDRRYVEEGQINNRTTSFISVPSRVPHDPEYDECRKRVFQYAEQEIPFPSPAFDTFVLAAQRVLFDPDAVPEKEYSFYLSLLENHGNQGQSPAVR